MTYLFESMRHSQNSSADEGNKNVGEDLDRTCRTIVGMHPPNCHLASPHRSSQLKVVCGEDILAVNARAALPLPCQVGLFVISLLHQVLIISITNALKLLKKWNSEFTP